MVLWQHQNPDRPMMMRHTKNGSRASQLELANKVLHSSVFTLSSTIKTEESSLSGM